MSCELDPDRLEYCGFCRACNAEALASRLQDTIDSGHLYTTKMIENYEEYIKTLENKLQNLINLRKQDIENLQKTQKEKIKKLLPEKFIDNFFERNKGLFEALATNVMCPKCRKIKSLPFYNLGKDFNSFEGCKDCYEEIKKEDSKV